jgi:hypothetical protein
MARKWRITEREFQHCLNESHKIAQDDDDKEEEEEKWLLDQI